jgi:aryl-alcohol dehydrogenase-like predicted oxidoreductase
MEHRPLGASGLQVSLLGLGAGAIGSADLAEEEVSRLLHGALDLGISLIDTAPSYGASEERIGRHLAGRREQVVLSTKVGYGVPGVPDWTGDAIVAGVDLALRRLRTDRLDVVHLHSCPLDVLRREDLLEGVRRMSASGKVRVPAYSGEGDALEFAIGSGLFGAVQASVNACDQRSMRNALPAAAERGIGVIAKRALANAPWLGRPASGDQAAAIYVERFRQMALAPGPLPWDELFLRFAAFSEGISACLVGTRRLENLARLVAAAAKGPLPEAERERMLQAWDRADRGWTGQI